MTSVTTHQHDLYQAFVPVVMQPVTLAGLQNPSLLQAPVAHCYDSWQQELDALVTQVNHAGEQFVGASRAILCSNNFMVSDITATLQRAGIPAISHSDQASSDSVFKLLHSFLNVLLAPNSLPATQQLLAVLNLPPLPALVDTHNSGQTIPEQYPALFKRPTASLHPSILANEALLQLHYDWLDFQRDAASPNMCALLIRMSDQLLHTPAERSQGYWLALQARQLLADHRRTLDNTPDWEAEAALSIICRQWDAIARRKLRNPFSQGLNPADAGFVEVMTLHKSKGQEFDLVWLPALTADEFPATIEQLAKQKRGNKAETQLKEDLLWLADQHPDESVPLLREPQQLEQLRLASQQALLEEKARLLYVGITRAKRGLCLSTHTSKVGRNKK
jgi:DNA helicase II / ATP-dependent DNA helicase PcrA